MSSYKPLNFIEVFSWDRFVGGVAHDPKLDAYVFEYAPEWIKSGIELAPLHMPLHKGIYVFPQLSRATFYGLPAMIADSLPDDFGNAVIDAWLAEQGIAKNNISSLDRLGYAGERAIGALTYQPEQENLTGSSTAIQLADIVAAARGLLAGKAAESHSSDGALAQLIQIGSSAGGARAKAIIQYNSETEQIRSGYANAGAGFEPWILKLDGVSKSADGSENSLDTPEQFTRIEYAYYLMATSAGIKMSPCLLLNEGSRAHFLTRRFDFDHDGKRLHQQSLCAIDHLDFRLKDTHSYAQYFNVIRELGMGEIELTEAFRRMIFNVLAMNRDDHTKNFAFQLPQNGRWQLAPAFDITHSFNPQGDWTQRHQMSVNSKFDNISRTDFESVGDLYGIPNYRSVIEEVRKTVTGWEDFAKLAGVNRESTKKIAKDIDDHLK